MPETLMMRFHKTFNSFRSEANDFFSIHPIVHFSSSFRTSIYLRIVKWQIHFWNYPRCVHNIEHCPFLAKCEAKKKEMKERNRKIPSQHFRSLLGFLFRWVSRGTSKAFALHYVGSFCTSWCVTRFGAKSADLFSRSSKTCWNSINASQSEPSRSR